jgi:hypothetical protein
VGETVRPCICILLDWHHLCLQLYVLECCCVQDILTLAEPLSGNLHEVGEIVKRLASRVLKAGPGAATAATDLHEVAGRQLVARIVL